MKAIPAIAAVLAAAVLAPLALAQAPVTGCVRDGQTGERLAGVNVVVEGTTLGTWTDRDGAFALVLEAPSARLLVSYIGFETRTVVVSAGEAVDVALMPRPMDLQPVVVSASREEERRTEAPVAVAALSARDLDAARPNVLAEALNALPGVHMTNLGGEQHNMSIRQPLSYKAMYAYLEDGLPIRPLGIFNHNALIEVNLSGVSRIEVVRGPAASLYGGNAVGGAVNFITARPSERPAGRVSVRSGSYGYRRADASASATVGRLGIFAAGYAARQREGWSEHSDYDKQSVTLRADYAVADATKLVATFSAGRLRTDTGGNLDSLNFYGRGFTSLQTFTYRRVDAARLTVRLSHVWSARQSTEVAVYGRGNAVGQLPHYRIRASRTDPTRAAGEVNEDRFRSVGAIVQHRTYLPWRRARLLAGATFDRSPNTFVAHHVDVERDAASGRYVGYTERDSLLTDYAVDLLNAAAFAQFELSPLAWLKLVGALRYDAVAYGYDNHLAPSAFSGAPDARTVYHRASPRAGLTVDLGGGRGLYASYSRGFVPPEVGELYRGVKVPSLRPATFDSYEAGGWAAFFAGRLHAEASVYRMDGTDEVITVRLDDGSQENRNAGATRHAGVEYAVTLAPVRALAIRVGGTNARHRFIRHEDGGQRLDGREMEAAPGWLASAELLYRPPALPGARLGVAWEHVGSYFMDPQNTQRYGGYDLLGLQLGYERRGVELWANVQNVADVLYASIASKSRFGQQYNPGAPRSVAFGVGYRFGAR